MNASRPPAEPPIPTMGKMVRPVSAGLIELRMGSAFLGLRPGAGLILRGDRTSAGSFHLFAIGHLNIESQVPTQRVSAFRPDSPHYFGRPATCRGAAMISLATWIGPGIRLWHFTHADGRAENDEENDRRFVRSIGQEPRRCLRDLKIPNQKWLSRKRPMATLTSNCFLAIRLSENTCRLPLRISQNSFAGNQCPDAQHIWNDDQPKRNSTVSRSVARRINEIATLSNRYAATRVMYRGARFGVVFSNV